MKTTGSRQQLNRWEQRILEISEREQRRIGHDLHDSLGQRLSAIAFLTSSLKQRLAKREPTEAAAAERIGALLDDALAQLRSLARGLHPVKPVEQGLMSALAELVKMLQEVYSIRFEFVCPQPVLVRDNEAATNLFRIAQEAVNNAILHSHGTRVTLRLSNAPGGVKLEVRDNGCGLKQRRTTKRIGMEIMRYRAMAIGAKLDIHVGSKRGTVVTCVWKQSKRKKERR